MEHAFSSALYAGTNDAPARIQIAIVGGACVVDGPAAGGRVRLGGTDARRSAHGRACSAQEREPPPLRRRCQRRSPEWRERFAFMACLGARSWRGRLALHLVALADAWHGLHRRGPGARRGVAGAQIAQIASTRG